MILYNYMGYSIIIWVTLYNYMGYSAYVDMPFHATFIILLKMLLFMIKTEFENYFTVIQVHTVLLYMNTNCDIVSVIDR